MANRPVGRSRPAEHLPVGFDGKPETMGIGAGELALEHSLDQRLIEIGLEARTSESEIGLDDPLGSPRSAPQQIASLKPPAFRATSSPTPQQNGAAFVELAP